MNPASERVAHLEARRAGLDLKIRAIAAKEREQRRRQDTRGKIILGAALLAFLRGEPVAARAFLPRLLPLVAERDHATILALFENQTACGPVSENGPVSQNKGAICESL